MWQLITKERKVFISLTSLVLAAGAFVLATFRQPAGSLEGLFRIFTDTVIFVVGLFVAGNASVSVLQTKWGAKPPEGGVK